VRQKYALEFVATWNNKWEMECVLFMVDRLKLVFMLK